jgi:hypothetical protein
MKKWHLAFAAGFALVLIGLAVVLTTARLSQVITVRCVKVALAGNNVSVTT